MKRRMVHVRIFSRLETNWQLVASIPLVIFMCSAVKNMEINNKRTMSVTYECTCLFDLAASREQKGISITSRTFKDEQKCLRVYQVNRKTLFSRLTKPTWQELIQLPMENI